MPWSKTIRGSCYGRFSGALWTAFLVVAGCGDGDETGRVSTTTSHPDAPSSEEPNAIADADSDPWRDPDPGAESEPGTESDPGTEPDPGAEPDTPTSLITERTRYLNHKSLVWKDVDGNGVSDVNVLYIEPSDSSLRSALVEALNKGRQNVEQGSNNRIHIALIPTTASFSDAKEDAFEMGAVLARMTQDTQSGDDAEFVDNWFDDDMYDVGSSSGMFDIPDGELDEACELNFQKKSSQKHLNLNVTHEFMHMLGVHDTDDGDEGDEGRDDWDNENDHRDIEGEDTIMFLEYAEDTLSAADVEYLSELYDF